MDEEEIDMTNEIAAIPIEDQSNIQAIAVFEPPAEHQPETQMEEPQFLSMSKEAKQELYKTFAPQAKSVMGHRMGVTPEGHDFMKERLKEWQTFHKRSMKERPYANEWYWDLRILMIQKELLSRDHSLDVCRSYLKNWCEKQ